MYTFKDVKKEHFFYKEKKNRPFSFLFDRNTALQNSTVNEPRFTALGPTASGGKSMLLTVPGSQSVKTNIVSKSTFLYEGCTLFSFLNLLWFFYNNSFGITFCQS